MHSNLHCYNWDKPQKEVPEEILQKLRVNVWADGRPRRTKMAEPIVVKLCQGLRLQIQSSTI